MHLSIYLFIFYVFLSKSYQVKIYTYLLEYLIGFHHVVKNPKDLVESSFHEHFDPKSQSPKFNPLKSPTLYLRVIHSFKHLALYVSFIFIYLLSI